METVLIVKKGEEEFHISDFSHIPVVNSFFQYISVRDKDGNYLNKNPLEDDEICVISGTVVEILRYVVKEHGHNSQTFRRVLYVTIQLMEEEVWVKEEIDKAKKKAEKLGKKIGWGKYEKGKN